MEKMETGKRIAIIIMMAVMLTGCAYASREGTPDKKSLVVAITSRPGTMDPQKGDDAASSSCLMHTVGTLYRNNGNGEVVPELAEGYEMSEDGCTYTIRLKEGLRFANGDPITAKDFVFALRRIADPAEASEEIRVIDGTCKIKNAHEVNTGELPVEELGVSAPDDRTLVIELESPYAYFVETMTERSFSPCSERFVKSCGREYASSPETMLSSGPFYVDRYQPLGTQIHYKKNPFYYDADNIKLDEITYRCVSDAQQANMCYQTGLVDITAVTGEFIMLAEGDESLKKNNTGIIRYVVVNERASDACRNLNIRTALSLSVDRDLIAEKLYYGGADPLCRLITKDTSADGEDPYGDVCGYDPEKAREYFEKGLKELGTDSLKLRFNINQEGIKFAEAMTKEWEECLPGLTFDVVTKPTAQYYAEMTGDGYDLCYIGITIDDFNPSSVLEMFMTGNEMNGPGYSNPDYDELVMAIPEELDKDKRDQMILDAEAIAMSDLPVIPVVSAGQSWLAAQTVKNFDAPGNNILNVSRVWKE